MGISCSAVSGSSTMLRIFSARNSHHSHVRVAIEHHVAVVARELAEPGAVPEPLEEFPPLLLRVVEDGAVVQFVMEPAGRRVQHLTQRLEVGPQLRLLLGGDRAVVERRTPRGRALEHGDRGDVVDDDRHHLDAARPGADDGDALADEVDRRRRPPGGVILLTPEVVAPRDVGDVGHREGTGCGDEIARAVLGAVGDRHRPRSRRLVEDGRGHLRVEAHVPPEIEAVDDMVEVPLRVGLRGEVLRPLPLVEQLLREQVAVAVALGVEARTRVAVPVPGASDTPAGLEQMHREADLTGSVQLVDAGDAGTDHQHVDVGRSGSHPSPVQALSCSGRLRFCTDR